jgi:hypothetical protein
MNGAHSIAALRHRRAASLLARERSSGMKLRLAGAIIAFGLLAPSFPSAASAQAMNGRQMPDRPTVEISYYKVEPGRQDEWVALYLKWHRPLMEEQIKAGVTLSSTLYANASHALEPSYDFVIINIGAPPAQAKKMPMTRGQLIKKLFPDLGAYTEGERERWRMTTAHWDQNVIEVNLEAAHPGVYYPILPED